MDEATPLTPFDTMTQTREIQMLKTVIPYMKSSQKKQFAILIKYMDAFKTNPVFQNLSPEKLSFLMNFANSKKPTEMKDMMPFLLGTLSSAKKQNIQFTKPETELMISILKQSMSPEEAEKADKIIRLMKERSGQSQ